MFGGARVSDRGRSFLMWGILLLLPAAPKALYILNLCTTPVMGIFFICVSFRDSPGGS